MAEPKFDKEGADRVTFAPFELFDGRESDQGTPHLRFHAWDHLRANCGDAMHDQSVDDYYLNGYGIEGLVKACRLNAGLEPEAEGIDYDAEGDACYVYFSTMKDAVETARLASAMVKDKAKIIAMIEVAREHGFEDG